MTLKKINFIFVIALGQLNPFEYEALDGHLYKPVNRKIQ
jgi:hypothetical protein